MQSRPLSTETLRHRQAQLQSRSSPALPPPRQAQCSQLPRLQPSLSSSRTLCQEVESCTQDILRLAVLCRNAQRKASSEVETHQTAPEDSKAQKEPPQPVAGNNGASPHLPVVERSIDREGGGSIRKVGLAHTPLSGSVCPQLDLPPPAIAVRNLVEQATHTHLCTVMSTMHHRRTGYPFGTLVDFACDGAGQPIFCLSPLAIHTRNILADPRCSMVVQMPGWSGLANARVTIFGDVYQLPPEMQGTAREIFFQKHAHHNKQQWVSGSFIFFRMHRISDIYFVGGFGTVQWIDVSDYNSSRPDDIVLAGCNHCMRVLNGRFATQLRSLMSRPGQQADDAAVISVDRLGADIRVRAESDYSVERLGFLRDVHTIDDAVAAFEQLVEAEASTVRPRKLQPASKI
ncbi:hypothetical protein WJX74_007082 [Apatococcus lobatus]|uniref:CREG-like beta-barrel domain-containing protein n=1 Tax=Apatococcus lobatus TaxID=904363 RepID=A0AAW1QLV6_9CHLO